MFMNIYKNGIHGFAVANRGLNKYELNSDLCSKENKLYIRIDWMMFA